jgi:hypothetical protein
VLGKPDVHVLKTATRSLSQNGSKTLKQDKTVKLLDENKHFNIQTYFLNRVPIAQEIITRIDK